MPRLDLKADSVPSVPSMLRNPPPATSSARNVAPGQRDPAAALVMASTLTVMAGATIAPALPEMADHFEDFPGSALWVRMVVTVTALAIALSAPVAGWVGDRVSRAGLLLGSVCLYAGAGAAGFVIDDLRWLLVSRAVLGVAVAGVMTASTALIADWFSGDVRARLFGYQAAAAGVGGAVCLSAGGLLARWSWQAPFVVYLLAVPLAILVAVRVRDAPSGDHASATPPAAARSVFAARDLWFVVPVVVATVSQIVFYTIPTQLPFHVAQLVDAGPTLTGCLIAFMVLVQSCSSLSYRRLAALGHVAIAAGSATFMAAGMTVLALAGGLGAVLAGLTVTALGVGLIMPNLNHWVTARASVQQRGRLVGVLVSATFLGQFLSPVLLSAWGTQTDLSGLYLGAAVIALAMAVALGCLTALTGGDRGPLGHTPTALQRRSVSQASTGPAQVFETFDEGQPQRDPEGVAVLDADLLIEGSPEPGVGPLDQGDLCGR